MVPVERRHGGVAADPQVGGLRRRPQCLCAGATTCELTDCLVRQQLLPTFELGTMPGPASRRCCSQVYAT